MDVIALKSAVLEGAAYALQATRLTRKEACLWAKVLADQVGTGELPPGDAFVVLRERQAKLQRMVADEKGAYSFDEIKSEVIATLGLLSEVQDESKGKGKGFGNDTQLGPDDDDDVLSQFSRGSELSLPWDEGEERYWQSLGWRGKTSRPTTSSQAAAWYRAGWRPDPRDGPCSFVTDLSPGPYMGIGRGRTDKGGKGSKGKGLVLDPVTPP